MKIPHYRACMRTATESTELWPTNHVEYRDLSSRLAALRALAADRGDRYVDLATASPVDAPPAGPIAALTAASAPGYPATQGTPQLRREVVDWLRRRRGIEGVGIDNVTPAIGSKEFLGLLPFLIGLGVDDTVVIPELSYPAYAEGAFAVGACVVTADFPAQWPEGTRLIWMNSPRNPDGWTLDRAALRTRVDRARAIGAVLVNDECYGILNEGADGARIPSILDPEVNGGSLEGILVCTSASKQSNLAGYRVGVAVGDAAIIARLVDRRRKLGLIVPRPVQDLLAAVFADDAHVDEQRERYRRRVQRLCPAVEAAGFRVEGSRDGMYVWATRDEDGWASAESMARAGILCAPGEVFGSAGRDHIRFAVSVSDADLVQAVARLYALASERRTAGSAAAISDEEPLADPVAR